MTRGSMDILHCRAVCVSKRNHDQFLPNTVSNFSSVSITRIGSLGPLSRNLLLITTSGYTSPLHRLHIATAQATHRHRTGYTSPPHRLHIATAQATHRHRTGYTSPPHRLHIATAQATHRHRTGYTSPPHRLHIATAQATHRHRILPSTCQVSDPKPWILICLGHTAPARGICCIVEVLHLKTLRSVVLFPKSRCAFLQTVTSCTSVRDMTTVRKLFGDRTDLQ